MRYKTIEKTILAVREELSLFKIEPERQIVTSHGLEVSDWDFADANTKIETHGFHTYPAMMIPQIARSLIRLYGKEGQTLLDPFCGSGTALVEARLHGLNSYGIDVNPLALLLARVKSTPLPVDHLKKNSLQLCNRYLKLNTEFTNVKDEEIIPKFFNIEYWFHPKVSRELSILKSVIEEIRDLHIREFFLVAFSQTVRDSSYTRNGEFKLFRIPKAQLPNHQPNVPLLFFDVVKRNIQGMAEFATRADKKVFVHVLDEDARKRTSLASKSIDLIVTSPPYGDSRTTVAYGQYSRLSLQWLGFPWERVRELDSVSLGGKRRAEWPELDKIPSLRKTQRLVEREDQHRSQDVVSFFFDLQLCMKEINRVSKKDSVACFVVGNRTVKGIKIPTDQILAEMGESVGYRHIDTIERNIPNKRMPAKNSPTNIEGKLGETMTKEHIVVLRKTKEATLV